MSTTYQIPATTHLGEVSLKINNLDRSIQFYTDVVGLKLLTRQDHIATMTADGKNVLLRLEEVSNSITLPERSHAGLYHFAILLPDRKSLGLAVRNLVASGIDIGQGDHLVSEAFYISDPDLNGIEIYADRPRDTWKRDADNNYVMASDPVDVQSLFDLSASETWDGLPAGTVIGHVHFHVRSLEEARAFYSGILGFDVVGNFANMSALFVLPEATITIWDLIFGPELTLQSILPMLRESTISPLCMPITMKLSRPLNVCASLALKYVPMVLHGMQQTRKTSESA